MKTREEIATIFNCTPEQVSAQFVRNLNQLTEMYNHALATGRKVNGYTAEQLRQQINKLSMRSTKTQ